MWYASLAMSRAHIAAIAITLGPAQAGCASKPASQPAAVTQPATSEAPSEPAPATTVSVAPPPTGSAPSPTSSLSTAPEAGRPGKLSCRCGVLDFESDGPPTGSCVMTFAENGAATLGSVQAKPQFTAKLEPKKRKPGERVYYAFDGVFEFECQRQHTWCGRQELSVLSVAEYDYRVTVARSADGPPSHVLWVTCPKPAK